MFEDKILSSLKDYSLTKLNKPEDWKELSNMAKKHVPVIEVPEEVKIKEPFILKVKVGGIDGIEHPNSLGHWINWVRLYAGENTFNGGPDVFTLKFSVSVLLFPRLSSA